MPISRRGPAEGEPIIAALLEELVDDNVAVHGALKKLEEGQREVRDVLAAVHTDLGFGLKTLVDELTGALAFRALKDLATELIGPLTAIEAMLGHGDFSEPDVVARHLESLAVTLRGVLGRMGAERIPVAVGTERYDPNQHRCVRIVDAKDSPFPLGEPGTVIRVVEDGYTLDRRPLRQVTVEIQAGARPTDKED